MNYLLLFIATFLSAFSYAQQGKSTMEFDSMVCDFGEINEVDGAVSHKFAFVNGGDKPFVIEKISVSCGCTKPKYSQKPILPGEKGEITITFNPSGRPGLFVNDIIVVSNNRKNRDVLVIKGYVNGRPLSIEEEYPFVIGNQGLRVDMITKSVGYVEQGSTASTAISYVNVSSKPLEVVVKSYTEDKSSSTTETYSVKPKGKGEFTITCDLQNRTMWGIKTLMVEYYINGVLQRPNSSITAIGTPNFDGIDSINVPKAKFDSTFKSFGDVDFDDVLSQEFTLENQGTSDLVIYYVQLAKGVDCTLRAHQVIKPGEVVGFEVELDAAHYNLGRVFANVYIILNDPSRPFREIRTVAYIE